MRRCRIPTLLVLMATTLPVAPVSASDVMRFRGPQIAPGTMSDMATGDFDEDGKVDLAVATYWPAAVEVFLGTGDGGFDAGWSGGAPSGEGWIAAGDVNADGHRDLVRGDGSDDVLSVFLGGGDGTFVEQDGGPLGGRTSYLELHDLDLDGALDVVAALGDDDRLTVRLGHGDGQFAAPIVLELEARPWRFALGDVDGDRIPDLLLPVSPVELRRGLGDGTFADPEPLTAFGYAVGLLDADGDGDLDVAVAHGLPGAVTLLTNDGRGGFTVAQVVEVGEGPVSLEVVDLDGDGRQDVLAAIRYDDSVSFLRNVAGGLAESVAIPTGGEPFQLRAVDLNGDDDLDLLVQSERAVTVQLAEGAAQFSHNDAIEMDWCVTRMLLADIDHDDRRDALALIRYNQDLRDLAVRRARADGTFGEIERVPVGDGAFTLDVADVTGDGLVDVVTGNRTNEDVTVLPGLPDGDLGPAITISGFTYIYSAAVGDLDGDGTAEILVCDYDGLMVVRSTGDGTFEAPEDQGFRAVGPLHVLDVDRDGHLDAAYGGVDPRTGLLLTAEVALGDGRGALQAPRSYPMLLYSLEFFWFETEFADLNGDGFVDVVQTSADASEISVLHGRPDGTFGDPILLPAPSGLVEPHLHDLTGDGRLDLIARLERYSAADFVVLPGKANGTFGEARSFGLLAPPAGVMSGAGAYDVLAADMDADGDADVLVGMCAGIIVAENLTGREAAADLDGNGVIGFDDLIALFVAWGPCDGAPCPADLDDDGTVGFGDLAVLLGAWGSGV